MGRHRLAQPSLDAQARCAQTGGKRQCAGHTDFYASYFVWTRHTASHETLYRLVPYDHPAPEIIPPLR
jgi:hypothetical protein